MFENNHHPYSATAYSGLKPTFFGKVMSFFALAVLSSAAGVYVTSQYFLIYFLQNPALIWIFFIVELALIFTSRIWSQKIPLNRFIFALFTFITGVTIAPLIGVLAASPGGLGIIGKALFSATLMFVGIGFIGYTTKKDLSGMRGFLLMALLGMIIVAIIGFFIPWGSTGEMIYSGIGVILFGAFTAYDFQNIKRYPEDRYIEAALALYLDIFNLFLFILRFLMSLRD